MPSFTLEESDFAGYLPDDTIVSAKCLTVKLQEKPYTDDDGNKVTKVVFKFQIDEPDGQYQNWDGVTVYGETSTKFVDHPDCKLRNWAQSILATQFPTGFRLDTDVLQNESCRIVLELNEWEDKKTGEPKQNNRVRDVMPARGRSMATPAGAGYPDEEPFRVDAGTWMPGMWGHYPDRLL